MTEKQAERIRLKIKKIRAALAADRRFHGGFYDDSRGLRYAPPAYYLQLQDWSGGLTYFRWFLKNFPDDYGFGEFWLEASIIYFKSGKLDRAGNMAYRCFFSNAYVFDVFFGRPLLEDVYQLKGFHSPEMAKRLPFSSKQEGLGDFAAWLDTFTTTPEFMQARETYIDLNQRINALSVSKERNALLEEVRALEALYGDWE